MKLAHGSFVLPGFGWLASLPMRGRLMIAFLSVSVLSVLVASFIAARSVTDLYEQQLEQWLVDAAQFASLSISGEEMEFSRVAGILAMALQNQPCPFSPDALGPAQDILGSAGYDVVVVYDENGTVLYRDGQFDDTDWLPYRDTGTIYPIRVGGQPNLLIGGSKSFSCHGKTAHILVGDVLTANLLDLAGPKTNFSMTAFGISGSKPVRLMGSVSGSAHAVPKRGISELLAGKDTVSIHDRNGNISSRGMSALRNDSGELIGIVLSQLNGELTLSAPRILPLFLSLCLTAGFASLAVAMIVFSWFSRPMRRLTEGLREVAEGDYRVRIPPGGGQELDEMAAGFNSMAEQLERLRGMELQMRRSEQLAALGEAAAVMAHEIRNPLGIIKTSSQTVRMKEKLDPSRDRLIGFILEEVDRIDALVQELLDYVRPGDMLQETIDLHEDVVARVIEFAKPELDRRHITSAVSGPSSPAIVLGDSGKLYQALLNILINAMDAMPKGGRITIGTSIENGYAVVCTEDTGIGIPKELQPRIFEPFVTNKPRGTGLGLAKARSTVEQHGGDISCESEGGEGTMIRLRVPLAPDAAASGPEESKDGPRDDQGGA